jgi:hypothetical protein
MQADVPVFVPCFNNPTYTARMVSQLQSLGFRRIFWWTEAPHIPRCAIF